ncbi:hypothetical protein [Cellulomonas sp. URHD0024]|uniref:hypothetical protein n=1 Tax=Cellulomonas sp. URHD0024 TaxID=1302620 RepID=UPI0004000988|nr:hypothetical protein [Cellulomonas sp. URHD0024]
MTVIIRIGIAVLFVNELMIGAWNAIAPESFYAHFPTVDSTPPFSEHLARDFGGATLGITVLLGIALVWPKAHFVVPAMLAYLVFAVPHFAFHLEHLAHLTSSEAVFVVVANASVALLAALVLVLTLLRDRQVGQGDPLVAAEKASVAA